MRSLWFAAGAGAGVYLTVRARRAAEMFTPEGLRDRLAGLRLGAQMFADEVRAGTAEKETQLRARLELGPDGHRPSGTLGMLPGAGRHGRPRRERAPGDPRTPTTDEGQKEH